VLDHINLQQISIYPDLVVRDELIVSKSFWNKTFGSKSKATARNWVSGLMNSDVASPYLRYIAYEVIDLCSQAPIPQSNEGFKI